MRITVAIDSFKGSLTTLAAAYAVREAAELVFDAPTVDICPLADGGEGTTSAIISATDGIIHTLSVTGPLGEPVTAEYGVTGDGTAIVEMAAAAGLPLVPKDKRNPLYTTTTGVGEMISHAISHGARRFIIGLGGSATNDGGVGMLRALGFEFLDREDKPIRHDAIGLSELHCIVTDKAIPELCECSFRVACDVTNPLCGPMGASHVYAPQKGATPEVCEQMDGWLASYAQLTADVLGTDNSCISGTGAAGGLGFAFVSYLGATLESGIGIVSELVGLERCIQSSDLVITGEGRLDGQSAMGKAPLGVAKIAKKYGKPVIAFSGAVSGEAAVCNSMGIDAFFPIVRAPVSLDEAMNSHNAYRNLRDTAEQVLRLVRLCGLGADTLDC